MFSTTTLLKPAPNAAAQEPTAITITVSTVLNATAKGLCNRLTPNHPAQMSTPKTAPDFGEPWNLDTGDDDILIRSRFGQVVSTNTLERIVSCVNACAGMSDPAAEIQALREAVRAASIALLRYDVEDVDLAEGEEMTITVTAEDQQSLRQSLSKLQSLA